MSAHPWRRLALVAAITGAAVFGLSLLLSAAGVPPWLRLLIGAGIGLHVGVGFAVRELRR